MSAPVFATIVPGIPHPLQCPEANEGWGRLRAAFEQARQAMLASGAERLLIYSTMWPSVIGHQIQAREISEWVHVDELFHDLGSIPYRFEMDPKLAHALQDAALARGLEARTVDYHGFPIDTGSVVALKLLNPNNELPACIVSSNVYADRLETTVLGKAARDAIEAVGKKTAVCVVATLSNRLFTDYIDPKEDRVHSLKDDEWNRKLLEFLDAGRLEDVAQLSRNIHDQVRVKKVVNYKPMWWLSAVMGQHNHYDGEVLAYEALYGTGAAVVTLTPSEGGMGAKEYDEDDVEVFRGDRDVLSGQGAETPTEEPSPSAETPAPDAPATAVEDDGTVRTQAAPAPVGAYPHARREGDLLYLSGIGPRQAGTDAIPGGPVRDENGAPLDYDASAQTRAVIENIKTILEAAGSNLDQVIDVTSFLVDMDRDFKAYNAVYSEYFTSIQATRTTVEVRALPTPIAVELKVIARAKPSS
jgi:reactive intermediate/imine deaminase